MCSQKEDFEKSIVGYYGCKFKSPCKYSSREEKFISDEDVIVAGKKIKVVLFATYSPPDIYSAYSGSDQVLMKIIVDDHGIEFILTGYTFELDQNCKKILMCKSPNYTISLTETLVELENIFKTWDSSMDNFITKLKILNISIL